MNKTNLIMESYLSGDALEWLNQIPENIIDEAIQILGIDPNKEMKPKGYSPAKRDLSWWNTTKVCFWCDLVDVIHRWGMPPPSKMQTSPKNLRIHAEDIRKKLLEATETLRSLEYSSLFKKGTMSKEFKFGYGLRQVSEVLRANLEGNRKTLFAPLLIKQDYDSEGKWGKYFPLDHDLEDTLRGLESIIGAINHLLEDPHYIVAERGKKKKGKDNFDALVWGLCHLYQKYTGDVPVAYVDAMSEEVIGNIIPFLRLTLNQTYYPFSTEDFALEKKIRELKTHPIHGKLWQDAKS